MRVLHQNVGQRLQLVAAVGGARRVGRRVEAQPFGPGRDRGVKLLGPDLEVLVDPGFDDDGLAAGELHDVGIAPPIGRSEERCVGKECVSMCRYWWSPSY